MEKKRYSFLPAYLFRQRGGIFFSFLVGVMTGLVLSAALALFITRTPIPFLEKSAVLPVVEANNSSRFDPNRLFRWIQNGVVGSQESLELPVTASDSDVSQQAKKNTPDELPTVNELFPPPEASPRDEADSKESENFLPPEEAAVLAQKKTPEPYLPSPAKSQDNRDDVSSLETETDQLGLDEVPASARSVERYFLEAGAFPDVYQASELKAKLAFWGVQARVIFAQSQEDGARHLVILGPYTPAEVSVVQERLFKGGFKTKKLSR